MSDSEQLPSQLPPLTRDQWDAHHDRLYDTIERMELEYDKALLALHPLAISVTSALVVALWNNRAEVPNYFFIHCAWGVWILGITATLLSFRLSAKLHILAVQEWIKAKDPHENQQITHLTRWVERMNWFSGGALVLGIISASLFLFFLPKSK